MLKRVDIECKLLQQEQGTFQVICGEILSAIGLRPYCYQGSQIGTYKTVVGTPDIIFTDDSNYIYVEVTTKEKNLLGKINEDVDKCLKNIKNNPILASKVTKILYMHNRKNISPENTEKIKAKCGLIDFDILSIETLSLLIMNKCPYIAKTYLDLDDMYPSNFHIDEKTLKQLIDSIVSKKVDYYKDDSKSEVKEKIYKTYDSIANIINIDEASIYLSEEKVEELKSSYKTLESLKEICILEEQEKIDYYHNLLVLLYRIDVDEAINKYLEWQDIIGKNKRTIHLYAIMLIKKDDYIEAEKEFEKIYYELKYDDVFEDLVKTKFFLKKHSEVCKLLSVRHRRDFDSIGYMASLYIISKCSLGNYHYKNVINMNNAKFKGMPLFYISKSRLLYMNNKKKKAAYYFKKGLKLIDSSETLALNIIVQEAKAFGMISQLIPLLNNSDVNIIIKHKIIEYIICDKNSDSEEIKAVMNCNIEIKPDLLDADLYYARRDESVGNITSSLKHYKNAFLNNKHPFALNKYVELCINNKIVISNEIINALVISNSLNDKLMLTNIYLYNNDNDRALTTSYESIYLNKNRKQYTDVYRQFWNCVTFNKGIELNNFDYVGKNCVVELINKENNYSKIILLEDNSFFEEESTLFNAIIYRTSNPKVTSLINSQVNDEITFCEEKFVINSIKNKFIYLSQECFQIIKHLDGIQVITSTDNDVNKLIEVIKYNIKVKSDAINSRLDTYEKTKHLCLSSIISSQYNFEDYSDLISVIFNEKDRVFYAGEKINVDLSGGFVIDITTLIILKHFDLLDIFDNFDCKKIYITNSTKRKFDHYYKSLLDSQNEIKKGMVMHDSINNGELTFYEDSTKDRINYWKDFNVLLQRFEIVEVDKEYDEIFTKDNTHLFDKCQFDSIKLANDMNIPYICDDLVIRSLSNYYKTKHSNIISLLRLSYNDYEKYLKTIKKLIEVNYQYTFFDDDFSELFYYYSRNLNSEIVYDILKSLVDGKANSEYYKHIVNNCCNNLRTLQDNLLHTNITVNVMYEKMLSLL